MGGGLESATTSELPLLGHRNWIVVVDSAYPLQTSPGIETISTGAAQTEVIQAVLEALQKTRHVRPILYTDEELKSVPEKDAPGIEAYRQKLGAILGSRTAQTLPHEKIVAKLDEAGKTFHISCSKRISSSPTPLSFFNSIAPTGMRRPRPTFGR